MSRFMKMVSMERTPEEKAEAYAKNAMPTPILDMPDVPYGLCISLTEQELDKLELDDDVEVGDMIHLAAFAKVTSVSKQDTGAGCQCRIELSIVELAVEDEDDEADAVAPAPSRRR